MPEGDAREAKGSQEQQGRDEGLSGVGPTPDQEGSDEDPGHQDEAAQVDPPKDILRAWIVNRVSLCWSLKASDLPEKGWVRGSMHPTQDSSV